MTEENKRKNKIIGISIGVLVVLLLVISSTYALWQITVHQDDTNILKAACLDFDVEFTSGITFEKQWPIPASEAIAQLAGYKFTLENKCDTEVVYSIGLESLQDDRITDYMQEKSIAIAIDDNYLGTYDSFEDLDGPTSNPKASKGLLSSTLGPKETKEHVLKIWIDEYAEPTEQNKGFVGKLFITGGQGVTQVGVNPTEDKCFTIDEATGEITKYDASCGDSVVIPEKVNNIAVKSIDTNAFKNITYDYNYNFGIVVQGYNPVAGIIYNPEKEAELRAWAESIGYGSLTFYTEDTVQLAEGQKIQYCPDPQPGSLPECKDADGLTLKTEQSEVSIKELDLSRTTQLEKIEEYAFTNVPKGITDVSELDNYEISLTSLNFGNNKNLEIGHNAFSRIDVPKLTLYASMIPSDITLDGSVYTGCFGGAEIDSLTMKAGNTNVLASKTQTLEGAELTLSVVRAIKFNELIIEQGITEIGDYYFSGILGSVYHNGLNLVLPNSLTKIGKDAFYNTTFDNVTIGSGIMTIGENAFYGMNSSQTITINKADNTGMTLGNNWSGNATVVYKN